MPLKIEYNLIRNITEFSHYLCAGILNSESIAVDLTCGNGNDTMFLAKNALKVYAFDIQQCAIDNTKKFLEENNINNVKLICDSHAHLLEHIAEPVDLFIANLGYLPNGDHNITTLADSTVEALKQALTLLKKNGLICVVVYYGHSQGKEEKAMLEEYVNSLDNKKYQVGCFSLTNQPKNPPQIILISAKE